MIKLLLDIIDMGKVHYSGVLNLHYIVNFRDIVKIFVPFSSSFTIYCDNGVIRNDFDQK